MTTGFMVTLGVILAIALIAVLGNVFLHVAHSDQESAKEIQ